MVPLPAEHRQWGGSVAGAVSVDQLHDAVRQVTRKAGLPADTPVRTDHQPLPSLTDLFGCEQWWELYGNPLGEYQQRKAYLRHLTAEPADARTLRRPGVRDPARRHLDRGGAAPGGSLNSFRRRCVRRGHSCWSGPRTEAKERKGSVAAVQRLPWDAARRPRGRAARCPASCHGRDGVFLCARKGGYVRPRVYRPLSREAGHGRGASTPFSGQLGHAPLVPPCGGRVAPAVVSPPAATGAGPCHSWRGPRAGNPRRRRRPSRPPRPGRPGALP